MESCNKEGDGRPDKTERVRQKIYHHNNGRKKDMTDEELLKHITSNPAIMVGKPVIRGTRLTVDYILNRLAHGDTTETVLEEYDYIKADDIRACLLFASRCMEDVSCMSLVVETA